MAKPKAKIIRHPTFAGNLKTAAYSSIVESLALVILGILFVIWPDTIVKILAYIIGAFLIVKGSFNIITYFMADGQKDSLDGGLLSGIIFILVGIASFLIGENIANVFRVIIGIIVVYESLVRINAAVKMHSASIESWKYVLALALIMMVLGLFITFNNGAVVALIGGMMIAVGIIGIVGDAMFIRQVDKVVEALTNRNNK